MRQYRAKRKDNGEWIAGYYIVRKEISYIYTQWVDGNSVTEVWAEVDPATVGQSTGLKDKNGKTIFEGDEMFWDGTILGYVRYEHGEYLVGEGVNARALCASKIEQREIVGNIHESEKEE